MQKFVIFILGLIIAVNCSASVLVTESMMVCRTIDSELTTEFLLKKRELPESWDEVPYVQYIRTLDPLERNISRIKIINTLALVPDFPEISKKISNPSLAGLRLFAISRDVNFDYVESFPDELAAAGGRFVIVIDGAKMVARSLWIPESKAKLILEELVAFDPKQETMAFEDINKIENDRRTHNELRKETEAKLLQEFENQRKPTSAFPPGDGSKGFELDSLKNDGKLTRIQFISLIGIGVTILILAFVLYKRLGFRA